VDGRDWRGTVAAAQGGDRRALDEPAAGRLPLVSNIVGCALGGHADVLPSTWDAVEKDVTTGPAQGARRYGLVRDTGRDDTAVPQYLTRATPADTSTVAQRSDA
jgi:hypothetical protein